MLSYSEARKLVDQDQSSEGGVVCYERVHWFGWVFVYQSKEYLESGDFSDMWVGNGPLLVNRFTGNVHRFGSHRPTSHFVWMYQAKWLGVFAVGTYLIGRLITGLW